MEIVQKKFLHSLLRLPFLLNAENRVKTGQIYFTQPAPASEKSLTTFQVNLL